MQREFKTKENFIVMKMDACFNMSNVVHNESHYWAHVFEIGISK